MNRARGKRQALHAILIGLTCMALCACAPRLQAPGPAAQSGDRLVPALVAGVDGALSFIADDGIALPLRHWPATAAAPADGPVLLALHGMNDYGEAFAAPAGVLAARGMTVYAPDQRGFGAAPQPGIWAGGERMADDVAALVPQLRARHPGRRLLLLGESMGGAVALLALARHPALQSPDGRSGVDGAILVAPAVWGRSTMPAPQSAAIWLLAHTLPWKELWAEGLDIRPSDNLPMLRALARDPLVLKRTRADALLGLTDLMDAALAAGPSIRLPLLLVYGGRDDLVPRTPTLAFIRSLPGRQASPDGVARQRVAIYADGYHMLMRDLAAGRLLDDLAAWVADPAAPLPSGADRIEAEAALARPRQRDP